jgi:hypothetical protein
MSFHSLILDDLRNGEKFGKIPFEHQLDAFEAMKKCFDFDKDQGKGGLLVLLTPGSFRSLIKDIATAGVGNDVPWGRVVRSSFQAKHLSSRRNRRGVHEAPEIFAPKVGQKPELPSEPATGLFPNKPEQHRNHAAQPPSKVTK